MSTPSSSGGAGGIGGGEGGRALLQLPVERSSYSEKGMASDDMSSSGGGGSLRSPPGLPHPIANATVVPSASSGSSASNEVQYGGNSSAGGGGESTSASLTARTPASNDQTTPIGGGAVGGAVGGAGSSQKQGPNESQLHIRSDVSAAQTLKPTPMDLPMEIATRKSQPATQTTSVPGSIQVCYQCAATVETGYFVWCIYSSGIFSN